MIKATELRIENKIFPRKDCNDVVEVTDIDEYGSIGTTAFFYNNAGTCDTRDSEACGIPLTPDWLVRCGFKDHAGNGWGYRIDINSVDELCWYMQDGFLRYQTKGEGFTRSLEHIKYFHQLQNLYFSLTGKDLIKETV